MSAEEIELVKWLAKGIAAIIALIGAIYFWCWH